MIRNFFGWGPHNYIAGNLVRLFKVYGVPTEIIPPKKAFKDEISDIFSQEELRGNDPDIILFGYLAYAANAVVSSDDIGGKVQIFSEALCDLGSRFENKISTRESELSSSELKIAQIGYQYLKAARAGLPAKLEGAYY
jgi:hypothetical protein